MKKFFSRIFNLNQNIFPILNQIDYSENGKFKVIKFERKYCKLLFEGQKLHDTEKYIVEMLVNNDELIVANKEIAILRPQIHGTGILNFFLPFDCKLDTIYANKNKIKCISVFHHTVVMLAMTSLSNNFSPKYRLFSL